MSDVAYEVYSFVEQDRQHWEPSEHPKTDELAAVRGGLTNAHLHPITTRRWKSVLSWAAFHPDEVSQLLDSHGQNALHHACLFKAPAHVVGALLYASPETASMANDEGELPIHWAVRVAAPSEILQLLLEASPKSGFVRDRGGNTAMSLLWERHEDKLVDIVKSRSSDQSKEPEELFKGSDGTGWTRIMLLVRSNYYGVISASAPLPGNQKFRPLHSTVGSCCPMSFVRFVLRVSANHVKERDEYGRLPLAVAAASSVDDSEYCKCLIKELLAHAPEAAGTVDYGGKLPLTLAVESGKTWEGGVRVLFEAEPRALSTRDFESRMYPFMLASVGDHQVDRLDGKCSSLRPNSLRPKSCDLDTVFCLLQGNPECVRIFAGG